MPELAIRCRGLEKTYPPDVRAVRGIDLDVYRGECFGLLGPNGAGKTTTVEILEGLLERSAGEVEILGRTWERHADALRQEIGISLQETRLPEKLSVAETIRLFRSFYAAGLEPGEAIELVGLGPKAGTWVGKLSGGQKQRLEIACALVGRPALLFLDEPTTGLDPGSRRRLWDVVRAIRAEGRTIVLTTHYMEEAERLCDRIAIIDHGLIIAEGTPRELIATLGGEHVIEFEVDPTDLPAGESPVGATDQLPGVLAMRIEGASTSLAVSEPHVTLPALLDHLERRSLRLEHLSTRHASLEDVFVGLTGRHLARDEER